MAKDKKNQKKRPRVARYLWRYDYTHALFFVMLYNPTEVDAIQMAALTASISGDPTGGGQSLFLDGLPTWETQLTACHL